MIPPINVRFSVDSLLYTAMFLKFLPRCAWTLLLVDSIVPWLVKVPPTANLIWALASIVPLLVILFIAVRLNPPPCDSIVPPLIKQGVPPLAPCPACILRVLCIWILPQLLILPFCVLKFIVSLVTSVETNVASLPILISLPTVI